MNLQKLSLRTLSHTASCEARISLSFLSFMVPPFCFSTLVFWYSALKNVFLLLQCHSFGKDHHIGLRSFTNHHYLISYHQLISVWSMVPILPKVESKCFTTEHGVPSAIAIGITTMLRWCVRVWVLLHSGLLLWERPLGKARERSGWLKLYVKGMKRIS